MSTRWATRPVSVRRSSWMRCTCPQKSHVTMRAKRDSTVSGAPHVRQFHCVIEQRAVEHRRYCAGIPISDLRMRIADWMHEAPMPQSKIRIPQSKDAELLNQLPPAAAYRSGSAMEI